MALKFDKHKNMDLLMQIYLVHSSNVDLSQTS